jgi:mono/diheme cytochrome c family protein
MKEILRQAVVSLLCLSVPLAAVSAEFSKAPLVHKDRTKKDSDAGALFEKQCATCHGKDGQAQTFKAKFNHARNLTDPKWQEEVSDERLFNSISNGKGKMPAWGKKLSEAQINSLVAYVRSLKR